MRIITGMHRSGTSLVARLFYFAGADMGALEAMYPGDRWNPDGYYERREIHAINMPLIHGPWWKLAYLRPPSTRTVLKRASRRAARIRSVSEQFREMVVKDARFCLTLPAWNRYGAPIGNILAVVRHPVAVARSLKARNRTTLGHGYRLWLTHNQRLLAAADDDRLRLVRYAALVNRDTFGAEIEAALEWLGAPLPEGGAGELYRRCVRPELDHHDPGDARRCPCAVEELWRELSGRCEAQSGGRPLATGSA